VLNEPSPICSLSPSRTCTVMATQKPLDVPSAAHEQHFTRTDAPAATVGSTAQLIPSSQGQHRQAPLTITICR
jgi:hypothetical protein